MTLKSVLEIDVKTERFERFKELFDQYNSLLAKQPKMWGDVGTKQNELVNNFQKMTAALMSHAQISREAVSAGSDQAAALSKSEGLWTSILTKSRGVLGNVLSTAEGMLKWTGILGTIGGLLGLGGGIFGIDVLANSTADKRRRAMGLGMSIGQMSSFDVNFGRLLDTQGFLGGINAMETDVTRQGAAYALTGHGLSGNTEADAITMLKAARGLAQRTPLGLLGPTFGAYGLDYDAETQRKLKQMSNSEFGQLVAGNAANIGPMNIQDKIAKGWQDLVTQWEKATKEIAAIASERLAPLQGPLERMSQSLVKAADDFSRLPEVQKAIKTFAEWLDSLNTKFASLVDDISAIEAMVHVVTHPGESIKDAAGFYKDKAVEAWGAVKDWMSNSSAAGDPQAYTSRLEAKYNLKPGTLDLVKGLEHSGATAVSPKGAIGTWQLMPATAARFGVKDPLDPYQNEAGAAAYLGFLNTRYHGNVAEILAAYNAGEGSVDKALAKGGPRDWLSRLPAETQAYVGRGLAGGPVGIIIEDKTGGNVNITVAGLGAPSP